MCREEVTVLDAVTVVLLLDTSMDSNGSLVHLLIPKYIQNLTFHKYEPDFVLGTFCYILLMTQPARKKLLTSKVVKNEIRMFISVLLPRECLHPR